MTLGEEESGAEGGWRAQEKQGKKMDREPEGFLKENGGEKAHTLSGLSIYVIGWLSHVK